METLVFVLSILLSCYLAVCGNMYTTIVPVSAEYSDKTLSGKYEEKPIARYGFHRIHECPNFETSYICIRKCLDLNFDVAYADKNCMCTCYKRKDKANYKSPNQDRATKWRLGAPTTVKPAWAHVHTSKKIKDPSDDEYNESKIHNIGLYSTKNNKVSNGNSNDKSITSDTPQNQNESKGDGSETLSYAELSTNSTGDTAIKQAGDFAFEQGVEAASEQGVESASEQGVDAASEQAVETASEQGDKSVAEEAGSTAGDNGGDATPEPGGEEPAADTTPTPTD